VWSLIGTARPSPIPASAVLMPTTRPSLVASAPPEFPGFSVASVWITLSIIRSVPPARVGRDRPSAETTPAVTEPANPCGFPIATTSWPTRRADASPSSAGRSSPSSIPITARSLKRSRPVTEKRNSRPSGNDAHPPRVEAGTTWAFVTSSRGESTTAAPPASRIPDRERRRTRRLATDGETRSTTSITDRE
jgi:hypothetical protein